VRLQPKSRLDGGPFMRQEGRVRIVPIVPEFLTTVRPGAHLHSTSERAGRIHLLAPTNGPRTLRRTRIPAGIHGELPGRPRLLNAGTGTPHQPMAGELGLSRAPFLEGSRVKNPDRAS